MIVEERDYTLKPGKLGASSRPIGNTACRSSSTISAPSTAILQRVGELNHVVAWSSYAGVDDRQARRARRSADPLWQAYLDKVVDLIQLQRHGSCSPRLLPLR